MPAGRIYGHLYQEIYSPEEDPVPLDDRYGAYATTDVEDLDAYLYDLAESDGSYELSGLSYGTYTIGWFYPSGEMAGEYIVITLDASDSEQQVDIYVPGW